MEFKDMLNKIGVERKVRNTDETLRKLEKVREMRQALDNIEAAKSRFNMASEDVIDVTIYEMIVAEERLKLLIGR